MAAAAGIAPIGIASAQERAETPRRAVRSIAPDIVAPPPTGTDEPERIDPRAPLSEIGPAGPARRRKAAPVASRAVATAAGRLEIGAVTVAVAGIEIVEPEATCGRADGSRWPCGMLARTAFRGYLRGRAVDCGLEAGDERPRLSAPCRLGQQDLGAWLVSNGWAKAAIDGPYAGEQRRAVEARRGIFGPGPGELPPSAEQPTSSLPSPAPLLAPEPGATGEGQAVADPDR